MYKLGMLLSMVLLLSVADFTSGQCSGKVDLSIAVPGSYIMPHDVMADFEEALIELFKYFQITPKDFNIGLVVYGVNAVSMGSPQPFKTRTKLNTRATLLAQRSIDIPHIYLGASNDVSRGIRAVREQLLHPHKRYGPGVLRGGAKKVGLIFTYGQYELDELQSAIEQAAHTKSRGITLYAISVNGTGLEYAETFNRIGTDQCRVISVITPDWLKSAMYNLASVICSDIDQTVQVTTNNCQPKHYGQAADLISPMCQTDYNMVMTDPNNCAYYYRCEYHDHRPSRFQCGQGTLYDPLILGCNNMENVACYTDLICPPGDGGLYPYPHECDKYLHCDVAHVPRVQKCPTGLLFDVNYSSCNETKYVDCSL